MLGGSSTPQRSFCCGEEAGAGAAASVLLPLMQRPSVQAHICSRSLYAGVIKTPKKSISNKGGWEKTSGKSLRLRPCRQQLCPTPA